MCTKIIHYALALCLLLVFVYWELWLLLDQHNQLHEYEFRLRKQEQQLTTERRQLVREKHALTEAETTLYQKELVHKQLWHTILQQQENVTAEKQALTTQKQVLTTQKQTLMVRTQRLQQRNESLRHSVQQLQQEQQEWRQRQYVTRGYQKQTHCLREQSLQSRRREALSPRQRQQEDKEAADHWAARGTDPTIQRALFQRQHPPDCQTAKLFILKYVDPDRCGHGCQVHYLSVALTYSFMNERTLVLDEKSFWFLRGDGAGEDFFRDYFQSLSWCHTHHASAEEMVSLDSRGRVLGDQAKSQPEQNRVLTADILYPWMIVPYQNQLPPLYRQQGHDLFWWRAQLTYYILTPLPETWGLLRAALGELCLSDFWPMIGIHSRQGSSVKLDGDGGRRVVYNSAAHIQEADKLAQRITGNSSAVAHYLFVATEYREELHQLEADYPDRFFLYFAGTLQDLHSVLLDTGMSAAERYKPYQQLHLIAITHLFTLVELHGFVGQLQSNYSRLVLELLHAIGKNMPHASVGGHVWTVDP